MKTIPYHNKLFRLLAAFGGTMYILFYNRPFDLCFALGKPMFYYAFVVSIGAALVIVTTVHRVTVSLDGWLGWHKRFSERILAQICLGIFAPAFIDVILFSGYFLVIGKNILHTGFFTGDLWIVIKLLSLLNAYYFVHYLALAWRNKKRPNGSSAKTDILNIDHNGVHLHLHVKTDVLCMYKYERVVKVLTIYGNEYTTNHSLAQLNRSYANQGLCHINQSFLVNLHMLKGYTHIDKRDSFRPIIKPIYQSAFPVSLADEFVLTKKYLNEFQKRLDEI